MALAMIDVDHFKRYNDNYGHQEGDACLRQVAATIDACAKRPGEMAARYGGEEFAVILPASDLESARRFGDMLCKAIRQLAIVHQQNESGIVTISVGVASLTPKDDEARQNLLAAADMALYMAKNAGRNRVVGDAIPTQAAAS
jgi:diguanylate cyclase (GGDEF)-like protein